MTETRMAAALDRVLLALEAELLEASDEEILSAAAEIGINPLMKGSSAMFGVTLPSDYRQLLQSSVPDRRVEKPGSPRRRKDLPPS